MNILAFDTSYEVMHVTLGQNDTVLDSRMVGNTEQGYNSAYLISTIADVMQKNNLKMQDVGALGVNIGPGSFTGLRACVTVGRVLAQQLEIPVVGIPSFQIYSMLNSKKEKTFCIMDARRGKAYAGIYNKNSDPVMNPCAMEYEESFDIAKSEEFFIISDSRMVKKLEENNLTGVNFQETGVDYGFFLLKQTLKHLKNQPKEDFNWRNLKPLYIQPPPITISKKQT